MNIESSTINRTKETQSTPKNSPNKNDNSSVKFADELKETSNAENKQEVQSVDGTTDEKQENPVLTSDDVHESLSEVNIESVQSEDKQTLQQTDNTLKQDNLSENPNILADSNQLLGNKDLKLSDIALSQDSLFECLDKQSNQSVNNAFETENNDKQNITYTFGIETKDTQNHALKDSDSNNLGKVFKDLSDVVEKLNQPEDKHDSYFKKEDTFADNKDMINNDFNIQDNKDLLPQMNPNMNFAGNGQPFSSFMNESSEEKKSKDILKSSAQDLAEEAAILSTMEENIAIANKNQALNKTKTITNEEGVKKVDAKTGIKVETIVQYDSVIMNQTDVEVFANLVANGEVDMNNLAPKAAEKATHISKALADMLAKSMENNQPLRINFDNNISVIIRISRDGKISADFLPSSQVAEAYLKETLPLLKQRFDENNIEYDSLNQRERQDSDKKEQRKKGRNNE